MPIRQRRAGRTSVLPDTAWLRRYTAWRHTRRDIVGEGMHGGLSDVRVARRYMGCGMPRSVGYAALTHGYESIDAPSRRVGLL